MGRRKSCGSKTTERPVPEDDEVRIRVHATTVSRTDCALRAGEPFISRFVTGVRRPKRSILGSDLAGAVEAVGTPVAEFEVGDHVFGINPWKFGAHAEFTCMRASASLAHMPTGMTFEEAAAVCDGAILALNALRPADLRKGQVILIYVASGSIGTAGVQLARYFGADVTAVCHTKNVELVRSLGADEVIDYTQQDFTNNGQTYSAILDAVGKLSFSRCCGSLKRGAVYLATDGLQNLFLSVWTRTGDKRVRSQYLLGLRRTTWCSSRSSSRRGVPSRHRPALPAGASGRSNQVRRNEAEDRERCPDRQARPRELTSAGPRARTCTRRGRTRCARLHYGTVASTSLSHLVKLKIMLLGPSTPASQARPGTAGRLEVFLNKEKNSFWMKGLLRQRDRTPPRKSQAERSPLRHPQRHLDAVHRTAAQEIW